MTKYLMTLALGLFITCATMAASESEYKAVQVAKNVPTIEFQNPEIYQVRPGTKMTGSKMTVHNNNDKDLVVTSFSCEAFAKTQLHNVKFENGERIMYEIKEIRVPAHSKYVISTNTTHLMMFKPERKFQLGEFLKITLHTNMGIIPIIAKVVPRHLK